MEENKKGMQVPYSSGRAYPVIEIPENACDSHHHIFDPVQFSYIDTDVRNQPPATVDAYRMLQKKLGFTRNVIVTPSAYGTDNSCTMDALRQMGKNARAVIVTDESIEDEELRRMDEAGVRGIRFNVARGGSDDDGIIQRMADRIAPLQWSVHFWMNADLTVQKAAMLEKLPCTIVFDHRGHLPADQGIKHEAFAVISDLMKRGKAYVKLSALYHDSAKEDYSDTIEVGKAYVKAAPDRVLWGTDWPHPSEFSAKKDMPDDARLLDALALQAPDPEDRYKILVDNPAELFRF